MLYILYIIVWVMKRWWNMSNCNKSKNVINLLFLIISTLFMCVGYAAINSISLDLTGDLIAQVQEGIFITEANYSSNVLADMTGSKIVSAYQTNLNSHIVLSDTDSNSSITYQVTIYNSTDLDYSFVNADYVLGNDTYSNENITFSLTGLTVGDTLESKDFITFLIKFYYKSNVISNNQLTSIINFRFEEALDEEFVPGTLINSGSNTSSVFGYSLPRSEVEAIYSVDHANVPDGATSWDASIEGNDSITAWLMDDDGDSLRELYIGTKQGKIILPADSSNMFSSYSKVHTIDLERFDTANVTNMSGMFSNLTSAITTFDVSGFDTSNVTNMKNMFYYSYGFTELDLSSFNTSKVTDMSYMFYYMYKLNSVDISNFDLTRVTNLTYWFAYDGALQKMDFRNAIISNNTSTSSMLFYSVPSSVYVIVKDDSSRTWLQGKLGSGKGTIVTVAELSAES